jgi:hypothetical protein
MRRSAHSPASWQGSTRPCPRAARSSPAAPRCGPAPQPMSGPSVVACWWVSRGRHDPHRHSVSSSCSSPLFSRTCDWTTSARSMGCVCEVEVFFHIITRSIVAIDHNNHTPQLHSCRPSWATALRCLARHACLCVLKQNGSPVDGLCGESVARVGVHCLISCLPCIL